MYYKKTFSIQSVSFFCALYFSLFSLSFAADVIPQSVSPKGENVASEPMSESISESMLSNDQLARCREKIKQVDQMETELNERLRSLESLKINRDKLKQSLEEKRVHVDWQSEASVNEYNQMNQKFNHLIQDYSTDVENYNSSVKQYKNIFQAIKEECGNKHYYQNKTK